MPRRARRCGGSSAGNAMAPNPQRSNAPTTFFAFRFDSLSFNAFSPRFRASRYVTYAPTTDPTVAITA